jgi:hypothetical protein
MSAVVTNGTIKVGVRDEGHLNIVGAGIPSRPSSSTTAVGLRLVFPDSSESEATAPGCLCEGWGASADGVSGYATVDNPPGGVAPSVSFVSFNANGVSAECIVDVGSVLRVKHNYHPSPATPFLYEVTVTLENISGATVNDLRYRRVMDWDISPTTFSECVTIDSGTAVDLVTVTDNGFDSPNPLLAPNLSGGFSAGDRVDDGPRDHGALFQFQFQDVLANGLAPGASKVFNIYYGAAFNQPGAEAALAAVGAEAFSFGKPAPGGVCDDEPNTFIFAFAGVGGAPIFPACTLAPQLSVNPPGTNHSVTATVTESGNPQVGVDVDFDVTAGPNAGDSGTDTTDGSGEADFTYGSNGTPGVDTIQASATVGDQDVTCSATKFWDADCNANGIADTCDIACTGFGSACGAFLGCGGSADGNTDGVPDECQFCGDNVVNTPTEECDGAAGGACPGSCLPPGDPNECQCPVCGDNSVNQPSEECDGTADAACPGACLPPGDPGQCTCPGADHFKCYTLAPIRFTQRTVSLTDQFVTSTATVIRPTRFCNPADKNAEGIHDPTEHLACYQIREGTFAKRTVLVRNQFGDQTLTVVKPEALCNPAEKNGVPSPLNGDHFKCYRVRGKGFATRTVTLADQFETRTETVLKPRLVCNPVDKNGGGIRNPDEHLTCYTLKSGGTFAPVPVDIGDQFGGTGGSSLRGECRKRSLLCVPSEKNPSSPSGAFLDPEGAPIG